MNKIKYNIAVSGASGFIGRALITKLIKEGHQVFGLVRNKITCYDPIYYKNILVEDISKNIVFDEKIKIDILYHLAAKTHSKSNNYKEYYDKSLKLMNKGGLINVDNVLWHGEVADENNLDKFTVNIKEFNEYVANDKRVEQIIVPLGDGMTVCRIL